MGNYNDITGPMVDSIMGGIGSGAKKLAKPIFKFITSEIHHDGALATAAELIPLAYGQGDPDAKYKLGLLLLEEEGDDRESVEEAVNLILEAESQGHSGANEFLQ